VTSPYASSRPFNRYQGGAIWALQRRHSQAGTRPSCKRIRGALRCRRLRADSPFAGPVSSVCHSGDVEGIVISPCIRHGVKRGDGRLPGDAS